MMTLLATGTILFWIALTIATIFIFISLEYDDWGGTGASITIGVLGVLLYFFGGKELFQNLWEMLTENTGMFFTYIGCYAGVGLIWSFVKWYFFLLNAKEKMMAEIKKYPTSINQITTPQASNHKGTIISWMTYWPFSCIWTLINDPVKRLFLYIFKHFEGGYQKISNFMFKDMADELKAEQDKARTKAGMVRNSNGDWVKKEAITNEDYLR